MNLNKIKQFHLIMGKYYPNYIKQINHKAQMAHIKNENNEKLFSILLYKVDIDCLYDYIKFNLKLHKGTKNVILDRYFHMNRNIQDYAPIMKILNSLIDGENVELLNRMRDIEEVNGKWYIRYNNFYYDLMLFLSDISYPGKKPIPVNELWHIIYQAFIDVLTQDTIHYSVNRNVLFSSIQTMLISLNTINITDEYFTNMTKLTLEENKKYDIYFNGLKWTMEKVDDKLSLILHNHFIIDTFLSEPNFIDESHKRDIHARKELNMLFSEFMMTA